MTTVMIGCPIRDREWIVEKYLQSIYSLNYPTEDSIPCFIINDSTDNTEKIITDFAEQHKKEYRAIVTIQRNCNQIKDARTSTVRQQIYSSLAKLRNRLLDMAKAYKVDYLFSVDSDILFEPETLNKLLNTQKDIISAQIWNESSKTFPNILLIDESSSGTSKIRHYKHFPRDSVFQCDITGAIYLLSKEVVQQVKYAYHPQGEDIAFCLDAKEKGFSIWCNSMVQCKHVMSKEDL